MALFGLFGSKPRPSGLKKHIERVSNKRAIDADRWESIQVLSKAGTEEALEGLLLRFTVYVDSSITDQEEKNVVFDAVVNAGDMALEPVVRFLRRAESIAWPLKMLEALCEPEVVTDHLLDVLESMDTEYERDPQRKIDVIVALGERRDPRLVLALRRFLEDSNETVRFSVVGSLLAQDDAASAVSDLLACYGQEESLRVRNRIVEGLAERQLAVPEARRAQVKDTLPKGYTLDGEGLVRRR